MSQRSFSYGVSADPLYHPRNSCEDDAGGPGIRRLRREILLRSPDTCRVNRLNITWTLGPMSMKFMMTQTKWAELKLWLLFYRIKKTPRLEWAALLTLELRLACSWYFQVDCLHSDPGSLIRRVWNEYVLKSIKTHKEFLEMAAELLSWCCLVCTLDGTLFFFK